MNTNIIQYVCMSKMEFLYQRKYFEEIYVNLLPLEKQYPLFKTWYYSLFENNRLKREREIVLAIWEKKVVGICILKNTYTEKKICTLKVEKQFQSMGIGKNLMGKAFEILNTDNPFFSISKQKKAEFEKLFKYYGFKPAEQRNNYYHLLKTEVVYNGELPKYNFWINKIKMISTKDFIQEQMKYNMPIQQKDLLNYTLKVGLYTSSSI